MNQQALLDILPDHIDGRRDFKIFGHFLEHFHRQIYGGVFDPGSHLSDANDFRRDVIEALRRIKTPVIRWPGGCFASAYPWKKRVDPEIELSVASIPDLDWNIKVLREAGDLLDWVSIHDYWSRVSDEGVFETGYEAIIARAFEPEARIQTTKHILGSLGYLGKIRIAFDEWNLRGWCHPNFMHFGHADHALMDRNDINSNYNMADAVFTACFLNSCLRHCDVVGMANFSPVVNTVGAIFTHEDGLVLRPTYHVFDLFTNHTYEEIVHTALSSPSFEVAVADGCSKPAPHVDAVVTRDPESGDLGIVLINLHAAEAIDCRIRGLDGNRATTISVRTLTGNSVDAYNDIDKPDAVRIQERELTAVNLGDFTIACPPHSVTVLNMI